MPRDTLVKVLQQAGLLVEVNSPSWRSMEKLDGYCILRIGDSPESAHYETLLTVQPAQRQAQFAGIDDAGRSRIISRNLDHIGRRWDGTAIIVQQRTNAASIGPSLVFLMMLFSLALVMGWIGIRYAMRRRPAT